MSMNKKFQRTRSSASTYYVSKKLLFFQDDVDEIARSTIIPFVNQRFAVVPKHSRSQSKRMVKAQKTYNEKNRRLACSIIYFRITKMVKNIIGDKLLRRLKLKLFQEKIQMSVQKRKLQILSEVFGKLKKRPNKSEIKFKIIFANLNFLFKRIQHNQTSYAFRKIALSSKISEPQEQKITQAKRKVETPSFGDNSFIQFIQNSSKTVKRRFPEPNQLASSRQTVFTGNTPYQLKPDRYEKKVEQIPVWRVLSHHIRIENNKQIFKID